MKTQIPARLFIIGMIIFIPFMPRAQTTISGKIVDEELNQQLVGENHVIQGKIKGISTDLYGNISLISTLPLSCTLDVSYFGFESQTELIHRASSNLSISFKAAFIPKHVIISIPLRKRKDFKLSSNEFNNTAINHFNE